MQNVFKSFFLVARHLLGGLSIAGMILMQHSFKTTRNDKREMAKPIVLFSSCEPYNIIALQ